MMHYRRYQMQQMRDSESVGQEKLWVCYCDFEELCSLSGVLRIFQGRPNLSLAKGLAFAFSHFCCLTGASKCNS